MCQYFRNFDSELTVKVFTLLVSTILAIKAIIEYQKSQKWKKNEFLAKEMKEFFADKDVKRALLIIDWNRTDLPLYENEIPENKKRTILFTDDHLENSLAAGSNMEFTEEETIIRRTVDRFLEELSMFQIYVDNKLVTTKDLKPYLDYWMSRIGDNKPTPNFKPICLNL
jgi:hypothetical protein